MTNKEIEANIKRAFENAAPDSFDSVMADCNERNGGFEIMEENKKTRFKFRYTGLIAACVAVLIGIFGFGYYFMNYAVDSTVSLDVNPSIEIKVNRGEKVLEVTPLNEDGKIVLGDMDLKGSSLDVSVNALIGSMLRNGYLSDISNSVLVSVDGNDPERSAQMQKRLSEEISALLQTDSFSGAVLSQTIQQDDNVKSLAEQYGISEGKAQLISQIAGKNPRYMFEELVPLSINELNLIANPGASELADVESVGSASDKGYIGEAKAKSIALKHAGVSASDIYGYGCEMDYEMGKMIYEIEFKRAGYEYGYDIDALSGKILSSEKERDDDYMTPSGNTSGGNTGSGNSGNSGNTGTTANSGNSGNTGTTANSGNSGGNLIGASAAKSAAFKHAGVSSSKATKVKCSLEWEHGKQVYEVEFDSAGYEYSYEIDASTGKVISHEKERDDDYFKSTTAAPAAPSNSGGTKLVGADAAKAAAFKHAGVSSGSASKVECSLEWENGKQIYEVEFVCAGYEYSYEIDAASGKVLHYEKDFDD